MAIIDWAQFNENFQYYDKEIINEVVHIFIDEYDDRINKLQKNIDEKDYKNLAFNAHSLKGVIANYMALKAYEPARRLEELANNNSEERIHETFVELKDSTKELYLELLDYLQKGGKK